VFHRTADQSAGNSANRTTDNRTFHIIACYRSTNRSTARAANDRALLGGGACRNRRDQQCHHNQFLHNILSFRGIVLQPAETSEGRLCSIPPVIWPISGGSRQNLEGRSLCRLSRPAETEFSCRHSRPCRSPRIWSLPNAARIAPTRPD